MVHQDGLGEFEVRVMLTELSGSESTGATGAMGWDGDQYAVYPAGDDHAIVWWSVWDSETSQRRFARILEQAWRPQQPPTREFHIQREDLHGLPAVVLVDAPVGWPAFEGPPRVSLTAGR